MKIKNVCLVAMLLLFQGFATIIYAQNKVAQAGMTFLKIGGGARAAAMGESFVSMPGDINSIFYNPAGLAHIEGRELMFSYTDWIADITHNAIAGAWNFQNIGTFAFSFIFMDYGEPIRVTQRADNEVGYIGGNRYGGPTFSPAEFAGGIAYSRKFTNKFSMGGHIKYVYQSLGHSNIIKDGVEKVKKNEISGIALDFGTVYYTGIRDLRLGFSITNFSRDYQYEKESFQLPLTMRIGLAMTVWRLEDQNLSLSVDALHPRDYAEQINFGGEYWYKDFLALRAGYKFNYDEQGLTLGVGFNYQISKNLGRLVFDYAYTSFGELLGSVNSFNIGFEF